MRRIRASGAATSRAASRVGARDPHGPGGIRQGLRQHLVHSTSCCNAPPRSARTPGDGLPTGGQRSMHVLRACRPVSTFGSPRSRPQTRLLCRSHALPLGAGGLHGHCAKDGSTKVVDPTRHRDGLACGMVGGHLGFRQHTAGDGKQCCRTSPEKPGSTWDGSFGGKMQLRTVARTRQPTTTTSGVYVGQHGATEDRNAPESQGSVCTARKRFRPGMDPEIVQHSTLWVARGQATQRVHMLHLAVYSV